MFKAHDDAEYWAFRAEEARAKADDLKYPHTRMVMLKISEEYDRLAAQAQERSAKVTKSLEEMLASYQK